MQGLVSSFAYEYILLAYLTMSIADILNKTLTKARHLKYLIEDNSKCMQVHMVIYSRCV